MNDRRGFLDDPEPAAPQTAPPSQELDRGWVAGTQGPVGPVRHDAMAALPANPAKESIPPLAIAASALVLLLAIMALLELANFAVAQFDKSLWLGWLTVTLIGPLVGVLGWSAVREWRGYANLQKVEGRRSGLNSDNMEVARKHAREWLNAIDAPATLIKGIETASDPVTLRALLRSGPLARLDQESAQMGRAAALQVLAATAVNPWPAMDGVLVVWRGMRLIRSIAELYGMRPGTLGTLRLWRRLAMDAGSVAATDVVVTAMADALLITPVGSALAGSAAGSALAARRMLRLAVAVARSCHPIDEAIT